MSESRMAELEALVQQGDVNAVAELIEIYRPRLLNFVKGQMSASLQQKVDPDDVVQEISMSCIRSVGDIDLSERNPFDWVCHVARRRIVDAARMYKGTDKRALNREVPLAGGADTSKDGFMQMLVASITSPSQACFCSNKSQAASVFASWIRPSQILSRISSEVSSGLEVPSTSFQVRLAIRRTRS